MPENWSYVVAAYGLAVLVLGGYWRYLRRRDRELTTLHRRFEGRQQRSPSKQGDGSGLDRRDTSNSSQHDESGPKHRSHVASVPAHPRQEPAARHPLP
jgi:hypothetical protein